MMQILERLVRPARLKQGSIVNPERWWMHARSASKLYSAIDKMKKVLMICRVSPQFSIARVDARVVPAESIIVFAFEDLASFSILQSRLHELWARFFGSSMKDDLRYAPSDCFETCPFPTNFETSSDLELAGQAYHDHRAKLMVAREEGMTRTYNRFHDRSETSRGHPAPA